MGYNCCVDIRYQDSWTEIHNHTTRNSERADVSFQYFGNMQIGYLFNLSVAL